MVLQGTLSKKDRLQAVFLYQETGHGLFKRGKLCYNEKHFRESKMDGEKRVKAIMKITIRKIAEQAKVSRGTVDKVLHHRPGVSESVRLRVQAVIDQNQYQPRKYEKRECTKEEKRFIAVILPRLDNAFFANIQKGMADACEQQPESILRLEYFYCDRAEEILAIFDYLEERGVDGIILRGIQSQELYEKINAFMRNQIPVIFVDADVPHAQRLCLIGEDSNTSGRVAASLLAKSIDGEGQVAVISGMPDITAHRERLRGFQDVIQERFPAIQTVEVIYSRDQSVITYEKTVALLQKYPKLRGIFSTAGCTGDIGQALLDQKQTHIKIVGYNFTPDIAALIRRGIVDFAIGLTPYRQGESAVRIMTDFFRWGRKPSSDFIEMPIIIGVDENIDLLVKKQMI